MKRLRFDLDLGKIETNVGDDDELVDEVLRLIRDERAKLNSAATDSHVLDRAGRTVGWWWIDEVDGLSFDEVVAGKYQGRPYTDAATPAPVVVNISRADHAADVGAAFAMGIVEGIERGRRR